MLIKKDVDYLQLLKTVKKCTGNVYYQAETDRLNIKSTLSQYVFLANIPKRPVQKKEEIICDNSQD